MTAPTPDPVRLTDDEAGRIVRASLDPDRVLAGQDGNDGSPPDVLLTTVREVLTDRLAAAEARATRAEAERDEAQARARLIVARVRVAADLTVDNARADLGDDVADRLADSLHEHMAAALGAGGAA